VDMDIRRFHDPKMCLVGLRSRGERMQRDQCGRGGNPTENRTARELKG